MTYRNPDGRRDGRRSPDWLAGFAPYAAGVTDLDRYRVQPDGELTLDLFVDDWLEVS